VRNYSNKNKLCLFTHIFDICNPYSGLFTSGFPQIRLVLCAIDYLLLVHIVFINILASAGRK